VDPVEGGAQVTAQARACGWPALVPAERLTKASAEVAAEVSAEISAEGVLERWWDWCLADGRAEAARIGAGFRAAESVPEGVPDAADGLVAALREASEAATGR
jgi:hypothetical protein